MLLAETQIIIKESAMERTTTTLPKERRAAARTLSSVRAYLIAPSSSPLPGIATNFSRSGVFLRTRVPVTSGVGDSAMVVFIMAQGNVLRLLRYPVILRRETHLGYGLEFWHPLWSTSALRR